MIVRGRLDDDIGAQFLKDEEAAEARALGDAVDGVARGLQDELRGQTAGAGLGVGLSKAWGRKTYRGRRSRSMSPASLVYSKSPLILRTFVDGATISARNGRFLVIPTEEAERRGFATSTVDRGGNAVASIPRRVSLVAKAVAQLGAKSLRLLPAAGGKMVLVYQPRRRERGVVLFVYVPSVRINARIDFNGAVGAAEQRLGPAIAEALEQA